MNNNQFEFGGHFGWQEEREARFEITGSLKKTHARLYIADVAIRRVPLRQTAVKAIDYGRYGYVVRNVSVTAYGNRTLKKKITVAWARRRVLKFFFKFGFKRLFFKISFHQYFKAISLAKT